MPPSAKPYVKVLEWQAIATAAVMAIAGLWVGGHGVLSALLGGLCNMSAGVVYAVALHLGRPVTAGRTLVTLFRAEAGKILVILVQLWLVLATYRDVVMPAFFGAFVITVLLFRVALFVRD